MHVQTILPTLYKYFFGPWIFTDYQRPPPPRIEEEKRKAEKEDVNSEDLKLIQNCELSH